MLSAVYSRRSRLSPRFLPSHQEFGWHLWNQNLGSSSCISQSLPLDLSPARYLVRRHHLCRWWVENHFLRRRWQTLIPLHNI